MADGNSSVDAETQKLAEEAKQLKAKMAERGFQTVDDLLSDRDKAAEERDHFKEHNEKAQKIIQKQGSELGELRKKAGVATPPGDGTPPPEEETVEKLESSLSEEEQGLAEEMFRNASDEEKIAFTNNPESRKRLLKFVRERARTSIVPKSLFGGSKPGSGQGKESDQTRIEELFNLAKDSATFYPDGSSGGTRTVGTGPTSKSPNPRPVGTGGVLSAVKRMRGE